MSEYEVILDGGGPWGIRLQGGKDFGVSLNVARVSLLSVSYHIIWASILLFS